MPLLHATLPDSMHAAAAVGSACPISNRRHMPLCTCPSRTQLARHAAMQGPPEAAPAACCSACCRTCCNGSVRRAVGLCRHSMSTTTQDVHLHAYHARVCACDYTDESMIQAKHIIHRSAAGGCSARHGSHKPSRYTTTAPGLPQAGHTQREHTDAAPCAPNTSLIITAAITVITAAVITAAVITTAAVIITAAAVLLARYPVPRLHHHLAGRCRHGSLQDVHQHFARQGPQAAARPCAGVRAHQEGHAAAGRGQGRSLQQRCDVLRCQHAWRGAHLQVLQRAAHLQQQQTVALSDMCWARGQPNVAHVQARHWANKHTHNSLHAAARTAVHDASTSIRPSAGR